MSAMPARAAAGRRQVPEQVVAAGEGVVGDSVEHHRPGVDDRPAFVRGKQVGGGLDDVKAGGRDGGFEDALQGQQPAPSRGGR